MDAKVLWALIMLGLAVLLFLLEVFIPSGGIIGLLAAIAVVTGVVLLFQVNTTLGLISAIVCIVAIPFVIAAMMKLWPNTPLFRLLVLRGPEGESEEPVRQTARVTPEAADMHVGDEGTSESYLRPVGICKINGRRIECIADGDLIPAGKAVRITHIDGLQVKVTQA
jgi:membrane-bound ClpP family serine protease